ncbi:flagellar hook-associated protein FlgL [Pantoea sp. GL120224-02]|jgi:flagellar hook-associated protein 3|uniref:flagellar hook-associated protein FlgL n=1 Tax=Pantoea sp. GL120224-02 TaxID=1378084 RepID=UPI000BD1207F|nr:flagellar hook-associated protein FlgL [Pantoea sp. GL120224-02]SNY67591.1 flagellar hook-associated protein 3 FlgL [Pantoea sp. GL120224-02]
MRLSTLYMFKQNAESMSQRVSENNNIYLRLSAGKSLLRASDDPQGATDAVKNQDALAKLELYRSVRSGARSAMEHEESILSSVGSIITTSLTEKIIAAKSDTYSAEDRAALGKELSGIRGTLFDLANTRDSQGRYIFSGYHTDTAPFDAAGNYQGGSEARQQTVADGTGMSVSRLGDAVFGDIFADLDKAVAELSRDPIDRDELEKALSAASQAVDKGMDRLGKAQAELGTHLQQLDSLDLSGESLINDTIVKVQNAIGADYGTMTSLIMDSKMSEYALNASMMVFQSMQKMNLFNKL